MNLGDILSPAQIISEMRASNRWEAIDELINNLVSTGKIKAEHHDAIATVVKKRESSTSSTSRTVGSVEFFSVIVSSATF